MGNLGMIIPRAVDQAIAKTPPFGKLRAGFLAQRTREK